MVRWHNCIWSKCTILIFWNDSSYNMLWKDSERSFGCWSQSDCPFKQYSRPILAPWHVSWRVKSYSCVCVGGWWEGVGGHNSDKGKKPDLGEEEKKQTRWDLFWPLCLVMMSSPNKPCMWMYVMWIFFLYIIWRQRKGLNVKTKCK